MKVIKDIVMLWLALFIVFYTFYFTLFVIYDNLIKQGYDVHTILELFIVIICRIPFSIEVPVPCFVPAFINIMVWDVLLSVMLIMYIRLTRKS